MQAGVDNILDRALDYTGNVVKGHVKDPEMPKWVQNGVDNVVDSFWPDVKEEAKMKVLSGTHAMVPIVEGERPSCCPNPYYVIRAYFLYHMFPSDKTMWGSFKDPVWWAFTLIALVPVFGISQMFYFIVFFLIDWADEYQIVRFILGFKGLSFVTTGVLPALIASVQYYICTAHTGKCYSEGPGEPLWTYVVFVVQVLIVWIAFAILPFTYKKGARKLIVRGRIMRKYDRNGNGVLSPEEARDYYRRRDEEGRRKGAEEEERKEEKGQELGPLLLGRRVDRRDWSGRPRDKLLLLHPLLRPGRRAPLVYLLRRVYSPHRHHHSCPPALHWAHSRPGQRC